MSYVRKCDNWIQSFRDWTIERSQVSIDLIDWAAIFTLASALRRKVALTGASAYLGSWDCYPYLYINVIGPAGIGKTTSISYAFKLLDQVPILAKPPTYATVEAIIDSLIKAGTTGDSSIYLTVGEMSDITMKDKQGKIYEFLNGIYDGKTDLKSHTMGRGVEFADKPCLNMFAGSTPEWVAENIPLAVLNGGYGSRCIWLYVPGLRRRRLFYRKEMSDTNFPEIEKKLVADLNHIANTLEGEFTIPKDLEDYLENWHDKLPQTIKYKKVQGYLMRKPVFVLKLAMIFHVAYSDSMVLNRVDFDNAINLINGLEENLPRIFEGVGKNTAILDIREIQRYVKDNPGIKESELKEIFISAAQPGRLEVMINDMLAAHLIRSDYERDENNRTIGARMFFPGEVG